MQTGERANSRLAKARRLSSWRSPDQMAPGFETPAEGAAHTAPVPGSSLPLAIAAVTVAGQCRERSPTDEALFGDRGARFAQRFTEPAQGQRLFAAAVAEGFADGEAVLETTAGPLPGRVSLWRQRGGDRVRLIAAFAPSEGVEAAGHGNPAHGPSRTAVLHRPLEAAIALATRLRSGGGAAVDDMLAALWRMRALLQTAERGEAASVEGEIDLLRLTRRAMRVADPAAAARAVSLALPEERSAIAGEGVAASLLVVADQQALWSAIDGLIFGAIEMLPTGAALSVSLVGGAGGQTLAFCADAAPEVPLDPAEGQGAEMTRLARAAGASLDLSADGERFEARLVFPPERCLQAP
ncbi:MAG: hypothetical protein AAFQ88_09005 [Pseudomonadota bacterium]